MSLGEFIEQERVRRGWSTREAARRCQLSVSRIQEIESGISRSSGKPTSPTMDALIKIARGFEIPLNRLASVAGLNEDQADDPDELEVVGLWRELSPENRQMAIFLLRAMINHQTVRLRPDEPSEGLSRLEQL